MVESVKPSLEPRSFTENASLLVESFQTNTDAWPCGQLTVDQFLEWFPGVKREQALAVLECAEKSLAGT
jgi:hypothetical protein